MSSIRYYASVVALIASAAFVVSHQSRLLRHSSQAKSVVRHGSAQIVLRPGSHDVVAHRLDVPFTFEPTANEAGASAQFIGRGKSLDVALSHSGIELAVREGPRQQSARASLLFGEGGGLVWHGQGRLRAESNYFLGNDPRRWRTHVPHFLRAQSSIDGVGVVAYGNESGLEYDLRLASGDDPAKIRLCLTGASGTHVDENGDLLFRVGTTQLRMRKPSVYEVRDFGGKAAENTGTVRGTQQVDGEYVLASDGTIGFHVAHHDPRAALVIDPSISVAYSSFLGGAGSETAASMAVDTNGKLYIGGTTTSPTTFPEATTAQIGPGTASATGNPPEFFIAKIDPTQSGANSLVYLSFLGGSSTQAGGLVAVDSNGDVAITGTTTSTDFPVTDSSKPTSGLTNGGNDTILSQIDPTGSKLIYSTLFGGNGSQSTERAGGITTDSAGDVFIASDTNSTNLPVTSSAYSQSYVSSSTDGFIAKFQMGAAPSLAYCTYLGLDGEIGIGGIAVDASDNAYVAGFTSDPNADFPTTNGIQSAYGGGSFDAFVMEISTIASGSATLRYATLLGGSGSDQAFAIALDGQSPPSVYVTGTTTSTNFPTNGTVSAYQPALPSNAGAQTSDAFLSVIAQSASGASVKTTLTYSTYLGGSQTDLGESLAISAPNAVYVGGTADSWDFPWHDNFEPFNGYGDAFVAKLDPTSAGAASLIYSTPIGGTSPPGANASAQATSLVLGGLGEVWITGQTTSGDFPTAGPAGNGFQQICASCQESPPATDAFIVGIQENDSQSVPSLYFSAPSIPLNFGKQPLGSVNIPPQFAAIKNGGEAPLVISGIGITGPNSGDFSLSNVSSCQSATIQPGNICSFEVSFIPSISGAEGAFVQITSNAPGNPQVLEVVGAGLGLAALPASLNFGSQLANTTSNPKTAILTNTSSDSLLIDAIQLSVVTQIFTPTTVGNAGPPCSGTPTLTSQSNCQISYLFTPSSAGTFQAQVNIQYHIEGLSEQQQVIPLSGVGLPPAPVASLQPAALNFGSLAVGATGQVQVVTLTNTGSAALNLTSIAITGTNAADFGVATVGNTPCPASSGSLSIGASCTVGVQFAPKTAGSKSASLSFTDNAAGSPQSVSLSGSAQSTAIQVAPTSLTFGNQSVGTKSTAQQVTVTNSGSSALAINGVTVTGANTGDFTQTNNCPPSLAANGSCAVSVVFDPTAPGSRTASISISDDAPDSPQTVAVTGTGTQATVTYTPTSISFGTQFKGTKSTSQSLTLTNTGDGALTVSAATLSDAADFTITNNCTGNVAPAGTCTLSVVFVPTAAGSISGTLTLTDNTPSSPQTVALSGTGIEFALTSTQAGGTSQTATAGQTVTYQLAVQSTAATPYAVALSCNPPASISCTVQPSVMAGGNDSGQFAVSATAPSAASEFLPFANGQQRNSVAHSRRAISALLGILALSCFCHARRRRASGGMLARAVLLLGLTFGVVACGGGGANDLPPPPQSYSINITANAAGGSQLITLTLTVEP